MSALDALEGRNGKILFCEHRLFSGPRANKFDCQTNLDKKASCTFALERWTELNLLKLIK